MTIWMLTKAQTVIKLLTKVQSTDQAAFYDTLDNVEAGYCVICDEEAFESQWFRVWVLEQLKPSLIAETLQPKNLF